LNLIKSQFQAELKQFLATKKNMVDFDQGWALQQIGLNLAGKLAIH